MTPLSAVPPPDEPERVVRSLAAVVDDTAVDNETSTDPEALLLCALMWSAHTGGVSAEDLRITAIVTADDFDDVAYRRMFVVIAGLVAAGEPYDPASVTAAFMRSGSGGAKDAPLRRRLNEVITAGADGFTAVHYADIVLSQSYRRSYRTVATAIVHAAEELPEEYLFDHLVEHGRAQRALWRRLNTFRAGQ
ncbi:MULTISPECIES: DnaB-like helicase N-terminal domain-containing protein [unclassified Rhodococcus (in: high G+C Gram-positive bacteria)]|uniref:DnaB-like helicase N-terminal domain-containing protein n=1 Tax=unclassified Rhodococcus (in: high G+C Gram-positive bacteria) TaxID=192944 RepID=UPI0007BC187E|nr:MULTISPECIES: DnaB-like helicase N-terminal domain-containing protein [unclassified Rhodococcus (in: high G+C Gram-positive bacteria)]KZF06232.1 hypothetical protein A2J02_22155 [Rhodococcus sp. EPR-147]KZF08960.1 hypothetical protein A2J04_22685 [Rhodococcus sp. EPR-279]